MILQKQTSLTTQDYLEQGIGSSLDKLPKELLHQASFLALSTTLATNACVENKDGRVFMIFIGVSEKVVRNTYRDYGFESLDDILFVEGNAKEHTEPGWDLFEMEIVERLSSYDSVAIAQMNAEENGGAYEQKAAELVRRHSSMPIVCAYHLFHDRNHPVETLLCGPAASVMGGAYLGHYPKSVIIDMGGTTSDIALVKNNLPIRADNGIQIGSWRTFVKGLYVDTFGLGGDSEICYHENDLFLSDRRVMPLCILSDFTLYDAKASRLAVAFLAKSTHHTPEEIPTLVYELVEKKLFQNIVRILLEDRFRKTKGYAYTDEINLLAEECFRFSKDGQDNPNHLIQARFQSDAVLVGVGAPIHVFLPEVARLLGTTCFVPEEAGVTNALGAVIGDIRAEVIIHIKANYEMNSEEETKSGYYVYGVREPQIFEAYAEALAYAKEAGETAAREKALERGAIEISDVVFREEQQNAMAYGMDLFLGSEVHVEVIGKMDFTS